MVNELALKITYRNHESSSEDLSRFDSSVSVRQKNLQV